MFAQLCQQITVIKRFSSLNPAIPVYENQKENSRNNNTSTMTMSIGAEAQQCWPPIVTN